MTTQDAAATPPTVFFVLGGPGSGKGTNCTRLARDFGYTHLSAGELLREAARSGTSATARIISEHISRGCIVPSEITVRLLKETMAEVGNARGYVIDGFPRKADQARMFETAIARAKAIVYLECSEAVMEQRLLARAASAAATTGGGGGGGKDAGDASSNRSGSGHGAARNDDTIETIRRRFRVNVDECMPVVRAYQAEGRCHVIDSDRSIDDVYDDVRRLFVQLGEVPLPTTTATTGE